MNKVMTNNFLIIISWVLSFYMCLFYARNTVWRGKRMDSLCTVLTDRQTIKRWLDLG